MAEVMFAMNKQVSVAGGFAHIIPGRFLKKVSQGASYNFPYVMLSTRSRRRRCIHADMYSNSRDSALATLIGRTARMCMAGGRRICGRFTGNAACSFRNHCTDRLLVDRHGA